MELISNTLYFNTLRLSKKFTHVLLTCLMHAELMCEIIGSTKALRIITGN